MAAQRLSCCSAFRWAIRCLLGDHSIVVAFRRGHKVVWAIKTGSQQNGQNMGDEKKRGDEEKTTIELRRIRREAAMGRSC